jgi:hypothetical protein
MRTFLKTFAVAVLFGTSLDAKTPAFYSVQDVCASTEGESRAVQLNDHGDVVGSIQTTGSLFSLPFIYEGGQLVVLSATEINSYTGVATAINNAGLVGYTTAYRGGLYDKGVIKIIRDWDNSGYPLIRYIQDVNSSGDFVGYEGHISSRFAFATFYSSASLISIRRLAIICSAFLRSTTSFQKQFILIPGTMPLRSTIPE